MREAKEEIGLDPSLVNAVTVLEPFVNKVHQGCATPFLCIYIEGRQMLKTT